MQPSLGESPVSFDGAEGCFKTLGLYDIGCFAAGQATEKPQFDNPGVTGIVGGEAFERHVNVQDADVEFGAHSRTSSDVNRTAAALTGIALARVIHQNAAHHFCRHRQKMGPVFEVEVLNAFEMEIEVVDEFGGLDDLGAGTVSEDGSGDTAQLAIDCLGESRQSVFIAVAPLPQRQGDTSLFVGQILVYTRHSASQKPYGAIK